MQDSPPPPPTFLGVRHPRTRDERGDSLFQEFRWWGAGEKLGRGQKIDEGKNRAGKGRERSRPCPPRVSFALATYYLTCSPLSKRLEQANAGKANAG